MNEEPRECQKYNIKVGTAKKVAPYRQEVKPEMARKLKKQVYEHVVLKKKYRDPSYSARKLAEELDTNVRYLSAVVNNAFGTNFSCLLNTYRIRDAKDILANPRYAKMPVSDIFLMVGFANRQSFYAAFYRFVGITPCDYRKQKMLEACQSKKPSGK